jgi:hypothetical protein
VEGGLGVLDHERVAAGLAADGDEDAFALASGFSISAVSVNERFLMLMTASSGIRTVPGR